MKSNSLRHLSDEVLVRNLAEAVARERSATAEVLAHIAEADDRKLYLSAAYPSMFAYCVGKLHLSEQAAFKRITAARLARRFPAIFSALAEGRLHLSALTLLAPHLIEDSAEELLAAAEHKSKSEVETLLAERFPKPDLLAWVAPMPTPSAELAPVQADSTPDQLSPGRVEAPFIPSAAGERPRVKPLSAQSFAVQFTLSRNAHEKLRRAQELLGHTSGGADIAQVFERALDLLIPALEKRKFAATDRPRRPAPRSSENPRRLPARVRRAVWKRDQGRCTFVSESGHRCEARQGLQFDHVLEVARGGESSVANLRLLCPAHNQLEAERAFGSDFMRHKRIAAAEARACASGAAVT